MDWYAMSLAVLGFLAGLVVIFVMESAGVFCSGLFVNNCEQPSSFWQGSDWRGSDWQGEWKCLEWEGEGLACENWHYPEACEEIEKDLFQECVERVWVERRSVD